jgi:hypothetical protein
MITYGLTAYVGHGDGGADLVVNCVELGQHDSVNRVRIVLQGVNSLILVLKKQFSFSVTVNSLILVPIPAILSLKKSLRTRMKKLRYLCTKKAGG